MTVAWYVHHRGAGHRQRALAVLRHLAVPSIVVSQLPRPAAVPDGLRWVRLPSDVPVGASTGDVTAGGRLHWAPPRQSSMRGWATALLRALEQHDVTTFVSDVSVEATVLARTAGIPVVVMRQHGRRDDPAHALGYDLSTVAVAPYPAWFEQPGTTEVLRAKTAYVGGLCRWSADDPPPRPDPGARGAVVVLLGAGGTTADLAHLDRLAARSPRRWIGLGHAGGTGSAIDWRGHVADPAPVLAGAGVVVSAAGHNSVVECAALRRPLVCVPEERPFGEQLARADLLAGLGLAVVAPVWATLSARHLQRAVELGGERLARLAAPDAARQAARVVEGVTP